jgi:UPF0176 protein
MQAMLPVLNISAYRFVAVDDPAALRERLLTRAAASGLKGTVLIAGEGINLFVAGAEAAVRDFVAMLRDDPRFAELEPRESRSASVPFRRLIVKVKREIIRMNHPAIRPADGRAPAVDAPTLARWLARGHDDTGREVVTLDTRNAFEVDQGRFRGAIDWRLGRFSDFPAAALAQCETLRDKTVVSYCTGGIRCEKAAIFLREAGLAHALQLDGGILRYFEQTGGAHFDGRCFVFDDRVALDPSLAPV